LDAYRAAVEFLVVADAVASALPRGRAYLADQLRRAAASIPMLTAMVRRLCTTGSGSGSGSGSEVVE
jgi:hypothetical protein